MRVPCGTFPLTGLEPVDDGVGKFHPFPSAMALQRSANLLGGVSNHVIHKMNVFQRGLRSAVVGQVADHRHGLALPQR